MTPWQLPDDDKLVKYENWFIKFDIKTDMEDQSTLYTEGRFALLDYTDRNKAHLYFKYSNEKIQGRLPFAALSLIEEYLSDLNKPNSNWKMDQKLYEVNWGESNSRTKSLPFNYKMILNYIKKNGYFDPKHFNLYHPTEDFLDIAPALALTHHIPTPNNKTSSLQAWNSRTFLGDKYPVTPTLKREGFIIGSFLDDLITRIMFTRDNLVKQSNKWYSFDWIFLLRDLINDCMASVEICLHLLYNKAQFDPLPSWKFEPSKLGEKHSRRLEDKLGWVYLISGNLFNIEKYKLSLSWLRELRNHFDPPSLCLTLEECADIINTVMDIAMIHLNIRSSMKLSISIRLINLSLLPVVEFNPEKFPQGRLPFDKNTEGYNTCRWPKKEKILDQDPPIWWVFDY